MEDLNSEVAIRAALMGRRVLVVGGFRREEVVVRLRSGLELSAIEHCETRERDASPRAFESRLRQSGIVLVVWVLGLSRHSHGEHLHRACRALGLPWVDCRRIPHPASLVARLGSLRLGDALRRRVGVLESAGSSLRARGGGA